MPGGKKNLAAVVVAGLPHGLHEEADLGVAAADTVASVPDVAAAASHAPRACVRYRSVGVADTAAETAADTEAAVAADTGDVAVAGTVVFVRIAVAVAHGCFLDIQLVAVAEVGSHDPQVARGGATAVPVAVVVAAGSVGILDAY